MRLCIGFDPGPRRTAWAIASTWRNAHSFEDWGVVDSTPADINDLLQSFCMTDPTMEPIVVVEQIFITPHGNHNAIRDTCQVAGGIAWAAETLGLKVTLATSTKWRRVVCFGHKGQATPGDKEVAIALHTIYGKSLPKKSNDHLRDALGVATYGNLNR